MTSKIGTLENIEIFEHRSNGQARGDTANGTQLVTQLCNRNFATTKPAWYLITAKYRQSNLRRSLWQLLDTFIPYCVLWAAMIYTVQQGLPYWITLALAVVAGGLLVRIFILFHDCCHGSFFASRRANVILG